MKIKGSGKENETILVFLFGRGIKKIKVNYTMMFILNKYDLSIFKILHIATKF